MPAQSPTLSPTLAAMTAGLRGSSSGMPASTLPTRSAPTSAPLVKMPPPSRAKIEISEEPNAKPSSGLSVAGSAPAAPARAQEDHPAPQRAGEPAALNPRVRGGRDPWRARRRGAHVRPRGPVHADEAAGARQHG